MPGNQSVIVLYTLFEMLTTCIIMRVIFSINFNAFLI